MRVDRISDQQSAYLRMLTVTTFVGIVEFLPSHATTVTYLENACEVVFAFISVDAVKEINCIETFWKTNWLNRLNRMTEKKQQNKCNKMCIFIYLLEKCELTQNEKINWTHLIDSRAFFIYLFIFIFRMLSENHLSVLK